MKDNVFFYFVVIISVYFELLINIDSHQLTTTSIQSSQLVVGFHFLRNFSKQLAAISQLFRNYLFYYFTLIKHLNCYSSETRVNFYHFT